MSGFRGIQRLQLGKLTITLPLAKQKPAGSVIILHGSCDTGSGMKAWLDKVGESEFNFHDYRILYPSAPTRPYTLLNGEKAGIWFDRLSLGPFVPEDVKTIEATANELNNLIQEESKTTGIPLTKMIVGGFSMGGIMALHLGYRFQTQVAGVFALSSFLPPDSEVYNALKERAITEQPQIIQPLKRKFQDKLKKAFDSSSSRRSPRTKNQKSDVKTYIPTPTLDKILKDIKLEEGVKPPQFPRLFMSQGSKDPLVLYPWARRTFSLLRNYGVQGHFFTHPTGDHGIERNQLVLLHRWIQDILTGPPPPPAKRKDNKNKSSNINDEACEPAERW